MLALLMRDPPTDAAPSFSDGSRRTLEALRLLSEVRRKSIHILFSIPVSVRTIVSGELQYLFHSLHERC